MPNVSTSAAPISQVPQAIQAQSQGSSGDGAGALALHSPDYPVRFYFVPELPNKGACFVLLRGPKWTGYLLNRIGVRTAAFFERAHFAHEPLAFQNGQPWAWIYKNLSDLQKDEARWCKSEVMDVMLAAAAQAQQAGLALIEAQRAQKALDELPPPQHVQLAQQDVEALCAA